MKKPKMILFDYGNTLLCEPGFDPLRGEEALFRYVKSNKKGLTPKQICDFSQKLLGKISVARDLEPHEWQFQRFLYEYLGIEFSISQSEAEKVFWDNASIGALMPNADKIISYINAHGIRSGVISNIVWSGLALTERINRLLPHNKFEFVIASSEYMFRKPNPMLFELALNKADLDASEVWFCGDNIKADVEGSASVGIFSVWYEDMIAENPWKEQNEGAAPSCEHLHIHDWCELISVLEDLEQTNAEQIRAFGKYSYPYHSHRNAEEMFVILSGSVMLRIPDGFKELTEGDIVFFEMGPEGAHQLYNHTDQPCRYLDIRTDLGLDVCDYPDSGKTNILPYREMYQADTKVDYFKGEKNVSEKWPDTIVKRK